MINEKTMYRKGAELVRFFNQLGFNERYGNGFPSRWVYTDGIHWDTTEDGTILNGEPGPYGEFARKLNEYLFTLDPEDREGAAKYAMYLIDYFYGSPYTIGSENPDWTDWVDLCANGLPVILYTVLFTEEGRDLLMQYLPGFLSAIYERYGICGYVGTAIGVAIVGVFVFDVIVFAKIMDFFIDFYDNVVVKVCGTIHNWAKSTIENIKSFAVKAYQKAKEWYESRTEAGRYASDHPQIVVDTKALGSYATRLNVVNNRLAALDKRMDSLYGRVGWLDLWNLLRADLLTGKSKTLKKCISYLRDTQTSFENVENELKSI